MSGTENVVPLPDGFDTTGDVGILEGFEPIPAGNYPLEVKEVKGWATKDGSKAGVQVVNTVIDGAMEGRLVSDFFTTTGGSEKERDFSASRWLTLLAVLGIKGDVKNLKKTGGLLVGKRYRANVAKEEYRAKGSTEEGKVSNKIKRVFSADGTAPKGNGAPKAAAKPPVKKGRI